MKLFYHRKTIINIICLFFTLLFIYGTMPTAKAAALSWDFSDISFAGNCTLLTDNQSNIYILSIDKHKIDTRQINAKMQCKNSSFTLNEPCVAYAASNGNLYFASQNHSAASRSLLVTVYNFDSDSIWSFTIPNLKLSNSFGFTVAENGKLYFLNEDNPQVLYCYSSNGSYLYQCSFPANILQLASSANGRTIFALTNTEIYQTDCYTSNQVNYTGKHTLHLPLWIDQNNMAVDKNGLVIHLDKPGNSYLHTKISTSNVNSGAAKEYFCRAYGNTIYGFHKTTGKKVSLYHSEHQIDMMQSTNNHIALFSSNTGICTVIDKSDFSYPVPTSAPTAPNTSSGSSSSSGNTGNSSAPSPANPNLSVSSTLYTINHKDKLITAVKSETTIAKFKENIRYGDMSISFTDYKNTSKTSGKIGTGTRAAFWYKNKEISAYRLIIYGDLTGEGNINSRDTTALKQHLLGKQQLESHFYIAADCNRDGTVDTLDLLKLAKGNL